MSPCPARPRRRGPLVSVLVSVAGVSLLVPAGLAMNAADATVTSAASAATGTTSHRSLTTNGGITTVSDASGWLATYTLGARTVTLRGPQRVLREPGVAATVTTSVYVRLLPQPFAGAVDRTWLDRALADTSPDVLAVALQYVAQSPAAYDASGLQYAGDASYGPLQPDGTRAEGSDFNDYLGVTWSYPSGPDRPEADQLHSLDCSGFVRMVYGYREGFPLELDPDGSALPRRAVQMAASAPGPVVIPDTGGQATDLAPLRPGDLVFFDASSDDGTDIDHAGIYLGRDDAGRARFISSRKTPDGPTMGDVNSLSVLSGTGFYARAFREARRL